jgi:hypothetical protein
LCFQPLKFHCPPNAFVDIVITHKAKD